MFCADRILKFSIAVILEYNIILLCSSMKEMAKEHIVLSFTYFSGKVQSVCMLLSSPHKHFNTAFAVSHRQAMYASVGWLRLVLFVHHLVKTFVSL